MNTENNAVLSAAEAKELNAYIDHLVMVKGGPASPMPLNIYRQDALRCLLINELARIARNYESSKVPELMPFAKKMLKRTANSAAARQRSSQCTHSEGSYGYVPLDAPLDNSSSDDSDATLHDCVADEAGAARGWGGVRLRRFYRVLALLPKTDRRILEALLDCDLNKSEAAAALHTTRRKFRHHLPVVFAHFRAIWRVLD